MSQEVHRIIPKSLYPLHYSNINFKTSFTNCVLQALLKRGWNQVQTGWNLQWSQKQRVNDVFEEGLNATQRCNHFRLWGQLCRKDMLVKNVRKYKRQLQKEKKLVEEQWNFYPLTFFLPSQYIMLAQEFKKKGGLWIMKPTSRCQGQGIFIVDSLAQVAPFRHRTVPATPPQPKPVLKSKLPNKKQQEKKSQNSQQSQQQKPQGEATQPESYLIQQYISKPLLLGRKKFDLRIYCLCTNYSQLTAWLYRSGFARFTHQPYDTQNFKKLQGHLTNVQIQKHSQNYDQIRGGKWLVDKFKHYLSSRYEQSKVDKAFRDIRDIIIRSLQAVQKNILPSKNSFELYGYDFMLDQTLKPWLIQVNGGPSMTANTQFDNQLKCGLIDDALSIIDMQGLLSGKQQTVGGFDLIVDKGLRVCQPVQSSCSCLLGARNQRKKVMRQIARRFVSTKLAEKQKQNRIKDVSKPVKQQKLAGKEKLLPQFYYKRKQTIEENSKEDLREQLKILQNQDSQFVSLKKQVVK